MADWMASPPHPRLMRWCVTCDRYAYADTPAAIITHEQSHTPKLPRGMSERDAASMRKGRAA